MRSDCPSVPPSKPAVHPATAVRHLWRLAPAAIDFFNRDPVVHTWNYKLYKAA
jgi:hypothetical protein